MADNKDRHPAMRAVSTLTAAIVIAIIVSGLLYVLVNLIILLKLALGGLL
jgi:heme/copper-type cytochrome/quinol oxidase subunit 4